MKRQEFTNLKEKKDNELNKKIVTLQKEISKLKMEMALRKTKNVSANREKKKEIARILTVLSERKVNHGK